MSKRFNYPLCFEPVFMHRIWGGRRLETMLGKLLPQSGLFGESWEISDQGEATSFVAGGPLQGVSLRELMREAPAELLGSAVVDRARQIEFGTLQFPLLVKWIDAREKLSLQVHPPDWYRMLRTGERAKSECWFVVEAEPSSEVYVGLRRGIDRPAMERELARGTVQCCLNVHTVRPGDFFYVPAGTPHAIGAGVLLAEIQQTSDTTFRLFDWNRLDPATGRQRELHLEAALDSIDFQASPPLHTHVSPEDRALKTELLAPGACPHFTVSRRFLTGNTSLGAIDRFHILICLSGSGKVASSTCSTSLARGGVVLLPATAPFRCTADRTLELLDVTV